MKLYPKVNNKVVGEYDTDTKTFTKQVKRDKHRFWKYNAYGIQQNIYEGLLKRGCEKVVIEEDKEGVFESDFSSWATGIVENQGFGTQVFLPINQMNHVTERAKHTA